MYNSKCESNMEDIWFQMVDPIWRTRFKKNSYMKIVIDDFCKFLITIVITIVELKIVNPMAINSKCTEF